MKTLYYSIIIILIFSISLYLKPIQADGTNDVEIKNIHTLPSTIIIGQTFKIGATLVNNSTQPIFVDHGDCEAPFSVTFDNHVLVNETHPICNLSILEQKLNPGENTTATSPNLDLVYRAIQNGTVNATITFPYQMWNQTIQSNGNEIISEPFSFTIYGKTRVPTLLPPGNQAIVDVALSIPGLQKWSNDWQYVDIAFMTAKNQPGNWQYAIVYLKASSGSSLMPCDSNNDWSAMVMIDKTTMKVIQATYPTLESHNCNYSTGGGPTGGGPSTLGNAIPTIDTPLKQFKSGIAANDIKCEQGLQLVIKSEDNSPACVKFDTATILIKHGWASSTFGISFDGARTYVIPDSSASFLPCATPFPQSDTGVAVLYMPTNSIGKVCVNYSNGNDPTMVTPRVFNAQNLSNATQDISVSPLQANVVHGNSTVVYTITSGNKSGFYGLTIFCSGTPITVGYDNQSRIVAEDFPWLHQTFYCPLQSYDYHIVGVGGGMGIKYVPP